MSQKQMAAIVHERYTAFDHKRKQQEALNADAEDMKALEEMEKQITKKIP